MLLIQASKANSEPGQTYKIRILAKFVNGLKFILRLIWWTLRVYCLDTWISDTRDPTDLNARKNHLFCTFQSLGLWLIESKVITGFLQLLGSLDHLDHSFSIYFLLWSVFHILGKYMKNWSKQKINGKRCQWNSAQTQVTKIRHLQLRNQTYMQLVWMAALISYSMAWSIGSPKFICLGINFSHHLD